MSFLDWLRSAVDYEGVAGLAVRLLKFSRNMELAVPMGRKMAACPMPLSVDYIVPVPIHWSRRAQRGFNQAEELADSLGCIDGRIRTELLIRHKATPPQARARGRQRRESLRGAFSSKPCPGVKVLLIDDVVTSGGTLEACAEALKSAGASWVGALTFARQISKGRLQ
ncbi:MAG: ComF family protein [Armatimonadetes bacterium]|nr:ComF family protein [Armatimonadota bacterium]